MAGFNNYKIGETICMGGFTFIVKKGMRIGDLHMSFPMTRDSLQLMEKEGCLIRIDTPQAERLGSRYGKTLESAVTEFKKVWQKVGLKVRKEW